uniref:Uncharacterized protein n=1 Tax=Romanomermis culicivorax TaxID=13658 RepID=A0A915HVW0_ROMCU
MFFAKATDEDYGRCDAQMESYRSCVKDAMKSGTSLQKLSEDQRRAIEGAITKCFRDQNCPNPFPSEDLRSARTACFQQARADSRVEIERCVGNTVKNFKLPQDENDGNEWLQAASSLQVAAKNPNFCPRLRNKVYLSFCLKRAAQPNSQPKFAAQSNPTDICKLAENCGQEQTISSECKRKWQTAVKPMLCSCMENGQLLVQRTKQNYVSCMRDSGFKVDSADANPMWLENGIKAWCPKSSEAPPCILNEWALTTSPPATVGATQQLLITGKVATQNPILPNEQTAAATTTTTTSVPTTTTTQGTTTTLFPNQNFFNFLANSSLFQGLVGGQAGITFLQNILSGQDLLTALFPGVEIYDGNQFNFGNLFGILG